jgi:hypothetical protein
MKRSFLLKYLLDNNCIEHREGANHTIMLNLQNKQTNNGASETHGNRRHTCKRDLQAIRGAED